MDTVNGTVALNRTVTGNGTLDVGWTVIAVAGVVTSSGG